MVGFRSRNPACESLTVNQLVMDKSFAINYARSAGNFERRIAQTLHVSRGAVRRHLPASKSNGTKAPTGSGHEIRASEAVAALVSISSQCEPFRELIIAKCELGLSAKRIHQDLVADHRFNGEYWSVNRFVRSLDVSDGAPFQRMEFGPGEELQVGFRTGAKVRNADGTFRLTHVFRCVLSHSRKGYIEAVFKQDTESFIRTLENVFFKCSAACHSGSSLTTLSASSRRPIGHEPIADHCSAGAVGWASIAQSTAAGR